MSRRNPLASRAFTEKAWARVEGRAIELLRQNGIFTDAQVAFVEMAPASKTKVVGAAAISQKYDEAKKTVLIGFDVAVDEKHRGREARRVHYFSARRGRCACGQRQRAGDAPPPGLRDPLPWWGAGVARHEGPPMSRLAREVLASLFPKATDAVLAMADHMMHRMQQTQVPQVNEVV